MLSIHHSLAAAAVTALTHGLATRAPAAVIRTPPDVTIGARVTLALAPCRRSSLS
jgi:hypothetical protein